MVASISKVDWENYRAVGKVPPSIREVVLQSWQRSARLAPEPAARAPLLAEDEIHATRQHSHHLRRAAGLALSRADYLLQRTGNMLLLCDRDGIILDAVGDSATLSRGRENHLGHGGRWSEAAIGTNAIGTAIHLGRPVQINGTEHYSEEIQRWSCAASPVKDPGTGRLLGVIDISWPQGMRQPGSTALSSALALQVESELSRQLAQERQALLEYLHDGRMSDQVLLLDRAGTQIFASEGFSRALDDPQALNALRERIPDLIDGLRDRGREAMLDALADCLPGASLTVIEPHSDAIGVMVSLAARRRRGPERGAASLARIAASGPVMAEIVAQARRLLQTGLPILIEGETGTGKTHLARAIHDEKTPDDQFTLLECAALTAAVLREDLAQGRLRLQGGTLCLDKPGRASPEVQKLLLSLIELAQQSGTRVITLAARPLYQAMQQEAFRSDLYYRVAGARLRIPPLRDRRDEIPVFLREIQRRQQEDGGRRLRFTHAAMTVLQAHAWPGNLREMQNMVSALSALSSNALIDERDLPPEMRQPATAGTGEETLRDVERAEILTAIKAAGGNLTEAARRLGIARSTLYLKLDAHGIARGRKT